MTRRQAVLASLVSLGGSPQFGRLSDPEPPFLRVILGAPLGMNKLEVTYEGQTITLTAAEIFAALKDAR